MRQQKITTVMLGQGVTAHVGEKLYLFLDEQAKKSRKPHGVAEVRADGLYVEGKKVSASRRSYITPAMRIFQDKLGHTNADGAMVSLNAYLKWHVLRDDKLVSLKDLKNPALARKRGQGLTPEQLENITLADLGL